METIPFKKRKTVIPGPAGNLPDSYTQNSSCSTSDSSTQLQLFSLASDDGHVYFDRRPWIKLKSVLSQEYIGSSSKERETAPTLASIINNLSRMPKGNRISFLKAVVTTPARYPSKVHLSSQPQCLNLRDETGSIEAAFDPAMIIDMWEFLKPGSAVALQNVGFILPKAKPLLIVSKKNLLCCTSLMPSGPAAVTETRKSNLRSTSVQQCLTTRTYVYKALLPTTFEGPKPDNVVSLFQ